MKKILILPLVALLCAGSAFSAAAQDVSTAAATATTEAGRVGDRPYARGRAYKADRYDEQ